MATTINTTVDLKIKIDELKSNDLGQSNMPHVWEKAASYLNGTAINKANLVYSDSGSVTDAGVTYDLDSSLVSILDGTAVDFVEVVGFAVVHKSTPSGETITIGAGSNPWTGWLNASGDAVVIGPGGVLVWTSPSDGSTITAGTGDVLTLTASGGDTISYDIIIWGRNA